MCSNGVWQLSKLTLKFCRTSGSSEGAREFIQGGLLGFAALNPHLKVETSVDPMKAPRLIARYVDGTRKVVDLKNLDSRRVQEVAQRLRDASTATVRHFNKPVETHGTSSVQGVWDPSVSYEGFSLRESAFAPAAAAGGGAAPARSE